MITQTTTQTKVGRARCPACGGALEAGRPCDSCAVLGTARASSRLEFTVRAQGEPTAAVELQLTPAFKERFELERVLGRGTSGMVVLATDRQQRRQVAIKVLMRLEVEDRARFIAEARLLAQMTDPHIVAIYELGELGEHPYLVCAYQPGGTLRERLAAGPLAVADATRIALDLLRGLQACHRAGIVHRDVKPENVLFSEDGTARLADLGIARHYGDARRQTQTGAILGTPVYMSPEQVRGEDAGTASDVHAMGLVLFEMLAGKTPFHGLSLADVFAAKASQVPDVRTLVHGLPAPLAAVVSAATALKIADRPATAAAMSTRLQRAVTGAPAGNSKPVPRTGSEAPMSTGARRAMIAALTLGWTALVAFVGWYAVGVYRTPPKLLTQQAAAATNAAQLQWTTDLECQTGVRWWLAARPQARSIAWMPVANRTHTYTLPKLFSDSTYHYDFVFRRRGVETVSESFSFSTLAEIQVFNIHVDEYATRAVVTWETNVRTDTTVKYGKTSAYDDLKTNPEQKSETIHSITIEGLNPKTTYHYQILASGPPRGASQKASEDLTFETSIADPPGDPEPTGMRNLVKSYVDKLTRMTPDEREKLKTSIHKFVEVPHVLSKDELKRLTGTPSTPDAADYYNRLHALRAQVGARPEARQALYHLERVLHVNPLRAAWRLDRAIRDVAAGRPLTPASVRAAPDAGVDGPAPVTAGTPRTPGSTQPAVPVDRADAKRSFETAEMLFHEGRIALEQRNAAYAAKFSEAARHGARAVRGDTNKPRALFFVGSALLYRDGSPEDLDRACELLEKSLALDLDKWTLLNLGQAEALRGRVERGVELLERALELDPKWAHAHFLASGLYDKLPLDAKSGPKAGEHIKAAFREKSEYKKKYQEALKTSEMANRAAKLILEIIEKSENDQLTDRETERYADIMAKDPSILAMGGAIAGLVGLGQMVTDAVDGIAAAGKVVLGPIGYVAAGFWSLLRPASASPTTTSTEDDD